MRPDEDPIVISHSVDRELLSDSEVYNHFLLFLRCTKAVADYQSEAEGDVIYDIFLRS